MTPPTQFQKMRANRIRSTQAAATAKQNFARLDQIFCRANLMDIDSGRKPRCSEASNYADMQLVWAKRQAEK